MRFFLLELRIKTSSNIIHICHSLVDSFVGKKKKKLYTNSFKHK